MEYLQSFGDTYEEFITEKPIVVTTDSEEEETEEWEASPPFLEVFLLKLNMANKRPLFRQGAYEN